MQADWNEREGSHISVLVLPSPVRKIVVYATKLKKPSQAFSHPTNCARMADRNSASVSGFNFEKFSPPVWSFVDGCIDGVDGLRGKLTAGQNTP